MYSSAEQKKIRLSGQMGTASSQSGSEMSDGIPNSVMASMMGRNQQSGSSVDDLGDQLRSRMSGVQQHAPDKTTAAEDEADRLSASVRGTSPEEVKADMGRKMGADFSGVRFHTDAQAEQSATSMGARAYAKGNNVYFGKGGFDAQIAAHELVHTVQQGAVAGEGTMSMPAGEVQMWPWSKKKPSTKITNMQLMPSQMGGNSSTDAAAEMLNNLTPEYLATLGPKDRELLNKWIGGESAKAIKNYMATAGGNKRVIFRQNVAPMTNANTLMQKYMNETMSRVDPSYKDDLVEDFQTNTTYNEGTNKFSTSKDSLKHAVNRTTNLMSQDKDSLNLLSEMSKGMDGENFSDDERSDIMGAHYLLRGAQPELYNYAGKKAGDSYDAFGDSIGRRGVQGTQNLMKVISSKGDLGDNGESIANLNATLKDVVSKKAPEPAPEPAPAAAPAPAPAAPLGENTSAQTMGYRSDRIGRMAADQSITYDPTSTDDDQINLGLRRMYDRIKNSDPNEDPAVTSRRKQEFAQARAAQIQQEIRASQRASAPAPAPAPKKKWWQFWKK